MRYVEVPVGGPGLDRFFDALTPTRVNGGTKLVRLKAVDEEESAAWFRT